MQHTTTGKDDNLCILILGYVNPCQNSKKSERGIVSNLNMLQSPLDFPKVMGNEGADFC